MSREDGLRLTGTAKWEMHTKLQSEITKRRNEKEDLYKVGKLVKIMDLNDTGTRWTGLIHYAVGLTSSP